MLPAVAIDLPPHTAQQVSAAILSSCNAALGAGGCVLASTESAARAEWQASVRWRGDAYRRVRIELRSRGVGGQPLDERELSLGAGDSVPDRWASAGVVVAALVVARQPSAVHRSEAEPVSQPTESIAPEPYAAPSPVWHFALDVGVEGGPGLDGGSWRRGGHVRFSGGQRRLPAWLGVSLGGATGGGEPDVSWWWAGVGPAARVGGWDGPLGLELGGQMIAERVRVAATDPADGRTESATRVRLGGRLGVELMAELRPGFWLLVGASAAVLRPEVVVEVGGAEVGRDPAVRCAITSGLRFPF